MCARLLVTLPRLVELLRQFAPERSRELDDLLDCLKPNVELDREEDRILFRAESDSNTLIIGLKCTRRLQAHGYVAGIMLTAVSTPGYVALTPAEREQHYAAAVPILRWAISRDLQQPLAALDGIQRDLEDIVSGGASDLPDGLLKSLSQQQRQFGEFFFRLASAYIVFHELAHLKYRHVRCTGCDSIRQEKEADRFAAEWLVGSTGLSVADRLNRLLGIAVALVWGIVLEVYLGPRNSDTHPAGYDRLFQVLDQFVDPGEDDERLLVWNFVVRLLLVHMHIAGFEIVAESMRQSPRDQANYLINLIASRERR